MSRDVTTKKAELVTSIKDLQVLLLNLNSAQQVAIEALLTGSTQAAAADVAGVSRRTVTRWAAHHLGFRAALEAYRTVLVAEQADLARAIRGRALAIVATHLDDGDLPTALAVLRAIPAPTGVSALLSPPTADVVWEMEVTRVRQTMPPAEATGDPVLDLLDSFDGRAEVRDRERAERLTATRLARASGLQLDGHVD
jgi:hypothetical protein